ncbi:MULTISPECIES: hypothetical protein [Paenibacillus]|uniref:Spo0E like sporulation regulatory protein n=3 Tax=Paenibacillus TaxID=44249 RepID=A0ABU3RDK6_9BACL|nr:MULTISPECIES: hypothetical protein [Paenibacillus]MBA2938333.1 hypothetical protein [Paenibacillus sp. CGMCC 1.16610]MCY9658623.1 hypothetical protein [Paenibacillus anseongense]MDU0202349.1 hypothetical protein [Paenibacillus sp. PFR10]MEB4796152.1 hypothetical protein [Paenibacillus chondroitinus]MEC0266189.1 hypothetical protein [Paenibacillus anseongense]
MNNEQFEFMFDTVLTDVVKQTYSTLSLPSKEQIQISMKKMMDMIEANHRWNTGNER